jgi:hypothetical protein
MVVPLTGLREIGTGYLGKEPHEYVVDVLRCVVRLGGPELGFEGCLTSRPFTSRTFVENRLGAMLPGRSDAAGAERIRCDLADGLAMLDGFGYRHTVDALQPRPADLGPGRAVVIGPVRVDDRWCPAADRIMSDGAWRHLIVERFAENGLICFDVLSGGYTVLSRAQLIAEGAEVTLVDAPKRPPAAVAVALRCLHVGAAWRTDEADTGDRNGVGLIRCAESATALLTGGSARRLRLALQGHALQAWRWSALMGHAGTQDMDSLALADVLRGSVLACRSAHQAVTIQDAARLEDQLRQLAALAEAITDLSARLASQESR